jgi:hypothetical protein
MSQEVPNQTPCAINDLDLVKAHVFKEGLICFNHTNTSSQNHVELIEIEYC